MRECDGVFFINVKPGDHVVFSCWVKTESSSKGLNGNPFYGGRIGIDFYGDGGVGSGRIGGTASPDGACWTQQYGYPGGQTFVPYGTSTWTKTTIDMIIPAQLQSDGQLYDYGNGFPIGQLVTPSRIVVWLQTTVDDNLAWYGGTELYVNP